MAPATQRQALRTAIETLEPEFLDLPDEVLAVLLPRPAGYWPNREMFQGNTDPVFDPLAVAATSADATVRALVQRERAARMVDFHRRDADQPDFSEVLEALRSVAFERQAETERLRAIQRRVQSVVVAALIDLAADPNATPTVRGLAEESLEELRVLLDRGGAEGQLARAIERFSNRVVQTETGISEVHHMPPGQPIGDGLEVQGWSACSW